MKTNKSYRLSGRFREILEVLQKAKPSRNNSLWRTQKRQLIPIIIHQIYPENSTVEISLQKSGNTILNVGDELYLKLETRDSSFKTKVKGLTSTGAILEFPVEIVLSESRAETRQYFHPTDEKSVLLKKVKNSILPSDRVLTISVADVSQTGMALILTPQQSSSLQVKDRILLSAIGIFKIQPPISGEIVFKISHETKGVLGGKELGSKIGIQLDKKIPKATFDRFCIREKKVNINDEQIVKDQAFRKTVNDKMKKMVKSLSRKKNLKNIFTELDSKQHEQPYLKLHIQMLAEVMCGLGMNLGWVSEATLDKLIYVAFLHDARYFSSPKLAKIQSLKDFEINKKDFTLVEKNIFLEGPTYSANLAREDSESYPDAPKILIQQKELPDGSGFPFGATSLQFIPLACLFIVSHYFVDYVLTHPDWTVTDFVKSHQKLLKGVYFQKVFQAMQK